MALSALPGLPLSKTMAGTLLGALLGVFLLAGLWAFPLLWPATGAWAPLAGQAMDTYRDIAVCVLELTAVGVGVYGARTLPFKGRARTSAELQNEPAVTAE